MIVSDKTNAAPAFLLRSICVVQGSTRDSALIHYRTVRSELVKRNQSDVLMATARVLLNQLNSDSPMYIVRVDMLACACPRHIPLIFASVHRTRRGTLDVLRCVPLFSTTRYYLLAGHPARPSQAARSVTERKCLNAIQHPPFDGVAVTQDTTVDCSRSIVPSDIA
ncbi:hypothetical protein BDV10DRAFT_113693 [Aspergillus recurvatus]